MSQHSSKLKATFFVSLLRGLEFPANPYTSPQKQCETLFYDSLQQESVCKLLEDCLDSIDH